MTQKAARKKIPRVTPYTFKGDGGNGQAMGTRDFWLLIRKEIGLISKWNMEEVLSFKYKDIPNWRRIVDTYDLAEKFKFKPEIDNEQPPYIKVGTTLYFPNYTVESDLQNILGSDLFLKQKDFKTFLSENQMKIVKNDGYVPFDNIITDYRYKEAVDSNSMFAKSKSLNIRVWVYIKSLGGLYDISKYIRVCETTKGFGVGNFSIELAPTLEFESDIYSVEFINQFSIIDKDGKLNKDWFSKFIQYNDLVYIRFERLKLEENALGWDPHSNDVIPLSALTKDLVWDMIGLVDTVTVSISAESNDYTVNMVGKDLTKLFSEDGSYFIPLQYVQGSPDRWFYGGREDSQWYKRNMITGAFDTFLAFKFLRIDEMMWFVINQLSNISIVDDSVLAYSAVSNHKFDVETSDDSYTSSGDTVNGIWKIVRLFVDPILNDRRIVDKSMVNPEGTLLDLFNKVCQQPFVEFWADTWGSEFDLTVRQPPFTGAAIRDVLDSKLYIDIASDDVYGFSLQYDERVYAWYRLMPQNDFMGSSQFSSLAFVPIIFFDEYCERFGNKRCIVNDIYLNVKSLNGKNSEGDLNTLSQALLNDLLFVVETECYLPFTRKGTITINGDRRIKVGTFVRLAASDELFYVTNVTHHLSCGDSSMVRTTTLTVERGMEVSLIKGVNNYFNIIGLNRMKHNIADEREFEDEKEDRKVRNLILGKTESDSGVNTGVFNFFMDRTFNKK